MLAMARFLGEISFGIVAKNAVSVYNHTSRTSNQAVTKLQFRIQLYCNVMKGPRMHFTTIFIWFMLYSILGWIFETIYCSIKGLKWDNRGMLIGPYCPIYGIGAVADVLLCGNMDSAPAIFFSCMLGSAVMEYTTSYVTEHLFHAVWWDYSRLPFNLNGRICLGCSLGFGVAGLAVHYGIHPVIICITEPIPLDAQEAISPLLMFVFAADCALTADSLAAINVKLAATLTAIDSQIAEKYDNFIANTRQNLSEGLGTLKEKLTPESTGDASSKTGSKAFILITMEEYRERRTHEEVKKTLSTMSWAQIRALRSTVSFRRSRYSEIGSKMKHALSFHKKKDDN